VAKINTSCRISLTLRHYSDEEWDRVLAAGNMNMVEIRDKRYDVVLHLVTAANGMGWDETV
jgi:hypothetical protein